ncbi:MAG: hypothetical protein WBJ68_17015 [Candidatus Dechloromonas phosphoritropha]
MFTGRFHPGRASALLALFFFTVARQTVEVVVEKYAYTPQEGGCASERFFPDESW